MRKHGGKFELFVAKMNFGLEERLMFYRVFANYLDQGIDLQRAVSIVYERSVRSKDVLAPMYGRWLAAFDNGLQFSAALAGCVTQEEAEQLLHGTFRGNSWVTDNERKMIVAGERGDNLSDCFRRAADTSLKTAEMTKATRGELTQPFFIALAMLAALFYLSYVLGPDFERMIPRKSWPHKIARMSATGDFFRTWWPFLLVGLSVCGVFIFMSISRWTGRIRDGFDAYLPPWNLNRYFKESNFLIVLAALMGAGRDISESVQMISENSRSLWFRNHCARMLRRLASGMPMGDALDTGLFSKRNANYIKDFAEANKFEAGISVVGNSAAETGAKVIVSSSRVVKYSMMCVMAYSIIYFYSAMSEIQDSVRQQASRAQIRK